MKEIDAQGGSCLTIVRCNNDDVTVFQLASRHDWWTMLLCVLWLIESMPPSHYYEFSGAYWKIEF